MRDLVLLHGTRTSKEVIKSEGLRPMLPEEALQVASDLRGIPIPPVGSLLRGVRDVDYGQSLDEEIDMGRREWVRITGVPSVSLAASREIAENYAFRGSLSVMRFAGILETTRGTRQIYQFEDDPALLYPDNPGLIVEVRVPWEEVLNKRVVEEGLSKRGEDYWGDIWVRGVPPGRILSIEEV